MSIPRNNEQKVYEKVRIDEMIQGVIAEVKEEPEHLFKGYKTKDGKVVPDRNQDAVKFIFELYGYAEKHHSRWMAFSYDDRSNLFKKYLTPLVSGIKPYSNFDIQQLVGMEVQVTWGQDVSKTGRVFQHVETIIPKTRKIVPKIADSVPQEAPEDDHGIMTEDADVEIPFE